MASGDTKDKGRRVVDNNSSIKGIAKQFKTSEKSITQASDLLTEAPDLAAQVEEALKDEPEKSNRQHGRELGVNDKTIAAVREELESTAEIPQLEKTVGAVRDELESTGEIHQFDKTVGADGKSRKAKPKKPKPAPAVFTRWQQKDPPGRILAGLSVSVAQETSQPDASRTPEAESRGYSPKTSEAMRSM